jgi:hypothetical protein
MFARVLWLLASIVLSCSRVHSSAVPINNAPRQATGPSVYPVLGVRGLGVGTTHPRLEIRELERNKDQLNVYLLGLQRLQNMAQNDKLSYYQIAGTLHTHLKCCSPREADQFRNSWTTFHTMGWGRQGSARKQRLLCTWQQPLPNMA